MSFKGTILSSCMTGKVYEYLDLRPALAQSALGKETDRKSKGYVFQLLCNFSRGPIFGCGEGGHNWFTFISSIHTSKPVPF